MNRREFLRGILACGAVAAAPKFIFDVGANLYKQKRLVLILDEANDIPLTAIPNPAWENAPFYEVLFTGKPFSLTASFENTDAIKPMHTISDKRYSLDSSGSLVEVPKYLLS